MQTETQLSRGLRGESESLQGSNKSIFAVPKCNNTGHNRQRDKRRRLVKGRWPSRAVKVTEAAKVVTSVGQKHYRGSFFPPPAINVHLFAAEKVTDLRALATRTNLTI